MKQLHFSNTKKTVRKLGEALLHGKLLEQAQLDEAIEHQSIHGGRLGTNLLELGYIDENTLARLLCQQYQRPFVPPAAIMKISPALLKLIPPKIALHYKALPLREEAGKLYLAMIEPADEENITQLSAKLGRTVIPLIVSEFRMLLALKKYYGRPMTPRYESLLTQLREKRSKKPPKNRIEDVDAVQVGTSSEDIFDQPWPLLGEVELPEEEISVEHVQATLPQPTLGDRTKDLLTTWSEAQNRDDIATPLLDFLKPTLPDCALLTIKNDQLIGWKAAVEDPDRPFQLLGIDLQRSFIFAQPTENAAHYLGPLTVSEQDLKLLDFFHSKPPQTALILPIKVRDRRVAVLYIQAPLEKLEEHFSLCHRLACKMELALQLLILRNKILQS